jgi:hypothetical protein
MPTCERWFWVSPLDGSATELTAWVNSFEVSKGIKGRYLPKTVVTRQPFPGRPGQVTTNRRHDYRQFPLPLNARSASNTGLQILLAELGQKMDPLDGPGTLRYVGVDGRVTELTAIQTADLDPTAWIGSQGPAGSVMTLMFEADEPYFLHQAVTRSLTGSDPGSWFPGIPWALGGSSVVGDFTVDTNSDALVWPIWNVVGPGSDPVFTNTLTGEVMGFLGATLTSGQTLTIDLTPGVKTIIGPSGANWFPFLDPAARQLFPLQKASQVISFGLTSATSASSIQLVYQPRTFAP